jgi:hypothetical protein
MHRSIILLAVLALAACSPPPPTPSPPSAAPVPQQYSCEDNHKAAAEHAKLAKSSILVKWLDDYRVERKALWAFHKIPEPTPCPKATP